MTDLARAVADAQAALLAARATLETKRQEHVAANAAGWTAYNAFAAARDDVASLEADLAALIAQQAAEQTE
ncbi:MULTISPECIES: hypothetical protein [unclassified Sphingobium]|uniref:hypothetical protein n=1 Tax=unclassified Sphingobium TaxID=2611147 RepID=UPI0022244131|nr:MULTISPECIES: hypothetical protein [unclassified Sphingobium]MCW2395875.1 hypothetical protein [Sphingobium sp. B8D3B]MCW2419391.1 hypothetical protein [Sphingobium sp. B8D3C]